MCNHFTFLCLEDTEKKVWIDKSTSLNRYTYIKMYNRSK